LIASFFPSFYLQKKLEIVGVIPKSSLFFVLEKRQAFKLIATTTP